MCTAITWSEASPWHTLKHREADSHHRTASGTCHRSNVCNPRDIYVCRQCVAQSDSSWLRSCWTISVPRSGSYDFVRKVVRVSCIAAACAHILDPPRASRGTPTAASDLAHQTRACAFSTEFILSNPIAPTTGEGCRVARPPLFLDGFKAHLAALIVPDAGRHRLNRGHRVLRKMR